MSEFRPPSQTRKKVNPDLEDALELYKKDVMLSLNACHIGTIQSFDSTKQTAEVTINYKRAYTKTGPNGQYDNYYEDYPMLLDVPVVVLNGGSYTLTFPIEKGDTCLVLFNDRAIDDWFSSGQVGPLPSNRLHSLSDGIALVGIRSANKSIPDYDMDHGGLTSPQGSKVMVGEKVLIEKMETLNDILQDLVSQIKLLTVICAAPGNPSSVPVNAAAFTAIATRIGNLLE